MAAPIIVDDAGTVHINSLNVVSFASAIPTSDLTTAVKIHVIPFSTLTIHDNNTPTQLPDAAATDDLGLVRGAVGTVSDSVKTSDAQGTTVTQYARFPFAMPSDYLASGTIQLRAYAGLITTLAVGTATVDFSAYKSDKEAGVGSDLVSTDAQDIKSLTLANKDFTITPSGIAAGDMFDVKMTVAITDSAGAGAVIGLIGQLALLYQAKG